MLNGMYPQPVLRGDLVITPTIMRLIRSDGASFSLDSHHHLVDALRLLDGEHDWDDVLQALPSETLGADFISWLTRNSLLATNSCQTLEGLRVRLYGTDALARALSSQILAEGTKGLTIVNHRIGTCSGHTRADRLADELNLSYRGRSDVRVDQHWICSYDQPDIAIVAGPGIQPDRAVLEDLRIRGIPTLLVSAHHDFARIGPLFSPGISCWRCADTQMKMSDPSWPECVSVLSRTLPRPTDAAVRWAAAGVVFHLMVWHSTGNCVLCTCALNWDAAEAAQHRTNLAFCCDCLPS